MRESIVTSQLRFSAYATQPDESLILEDGALLIAELAYPDLRRSRYLHQLDELAAEVWADLGASARLLRRERRRQRATADRVLECMREVLARRHGFNGNEENYYDPRNSFLNETLDRQAGLPLTLSVIYLAVARRIGAPLEGVGLPAHFMIKWPLSPEEGGDLFVDVFHGARLLDEHECRRFVLRFISARTNTDALAGSDTSDATETLPEPGVSDSDEDSGTDTHAAPPARFDPHWTEPMATRDILTRMLNNLKMVYLYRGETAHALATVERLTMLRPDLPAELRDRGLLRLAMGEPLLAAADIAAYVERAPTAPEAGRLLRRIGAVEEVRARLN